MSKTLVVLWLSGQAAFLDARPHLDSWSRARWVELVQPRPAHGKGLAYDAALVARIEDALEQARIASASGDEPGALSRLAEIETMLERHPELPQAAWLAAERHHVEASVWRRREDGLDRARSLEARARALEGDRARSFVADLDAAKPAAPAPTRVFVEGLTDQDRLFVDGVEQGRALELIPGEHHVRVLRGKRLVWAGWVNHGAGRRRLELPVPEPGPCSQEDLTGVTLEAGRVVAPRGTRCPTWIAARATSDGIEVARCHAHSCGPLLPWKAGAGESYRDPAQPTRARPFPFWWAVGAGVGAAIVTGAVLIHTGALDEPSPGRRRFEYTGPR